jgi:hypothetical protein
MFLAVIGALLLTSCKEVYTSSSNTASPQQAQQVTNEKFHSVRKLANLGFYDKANEKFQEVIEANPQDEVPEDLKYLSGGKIPIWRDFKLQIEPCLLPEIEILVAALSLYIIVTFILNFRKPRLDVQDFENGGTAPEIGKGLAAMIEEQLQNIDSLGRSSITTTGCRTNRRN